MSNSNSESHLTYALGVHNDAPGRWYENYTNKTLVTRIDLRGSSAERQHPIYPYFEKLQLITYRAKGMPFVPRDTVSFLDEQHNPTMFRTLLSATNEAESWKEQWTSDATVEHKIHLRLLLPDNPDAKMPARNFHKLLHVRVSQMEPKYITKTKLGYLIARSLKDSMGLTAFCKRKGYEFDDLALCELVNVSYGSWQPTLYVNTYGRPVRYSLYDPCSAFPGYTFE